MPDVDVKVLFFAKARELIDMDESQATLPSIITCSELKKKIFREIFPILADIETSCILAVDQTYVADGDNVELTAASEIAVIPPLSGG